MSEQGSTTKAAEAPEAPEAPATAETVSAAPAASTLPPTTAAPARSSAASRAGSSQTGLAASAEEAAPQRINRRKVREGIVVSNGMDKTAVVAVVERVRHPRYAKTVQRTKRLYVHDEENSVSIGDRVRVAETRPLSKLKRWRLVEILERAR